MATSVAARTKNNEKRVLVDRVEPTYENNEPQTS